MSQELLNLFNTNIRIYNMSPFDKDAVWPVNAEVVIARVPIRTRDGYSPEMMTALAEKIKAATITNGIVFLICYAPLEAKSRPYEIANEMTKVGFTHIDNIIINKSWLPGKRSEVNLVNSYDMVLHFCNGNIWKLDRMPIRQYLGTPDDVSCMGNVWTVETGSLDESYPPDLAELLIRMTDCLPGSVIFTPITGTSSALKACLKLGHSYYAFEPEEKRMKKYEQIIQQHQKQLKK